MLRDKRLIERRFSAHFNTYNTHAVVQQKICQKIRYMLEKMELSPQNSLEIGAGTGFLTSNLLELYPASNWVINDLSQHAKPYLEEVAFSKNITPTFLFGDAETVSLPKNLDFVASASTIQWFDDISDFLANLPLKKGGIAAFSTFFKGNFHEIATATASEGLVYPSKEQFFDLFEKNGYKIVDSDAYSESVWFESAVEVLRHLKFTGVNSIKSVKWSRGMLEQFSATYSQNFSSNLGVSLTYCPIIVIAEKL